mmetsp:Transcript_19300/g.56159  ORF Transcript_19300/g.56159 Transcript_19300/m.56159 type:complete len:220 (-) Transcript_19300:256-915(-)
MRTTKQAFLKVGITEQGPSRPWPRKRRSPTAEHPTKMETTCFHMNDTSEVKRLLLPAGLHLRRPAQDTPVLGMKQQHMGRFKIRLPGTDLHRPCPSPRRIFASPPPRMHDDAHCPNLLRLTSGKSGRSFAICHHPKSTHNCAHLPRSSKQAGEVSGIVWWHASSPPSCEAHQARRHTMVWSTRKALKASAFLTCACSHSNLAHTQSGGGPLRRLVWCGE